MSGAIFEEGHSTQGTLYRDRQRPRDRGIVSLSGRDRDRIARVICTERRFSSALLTCHLRRYAVPLFYNSPTSSTATAVSRSRAVRALLVERLRFPHPTPPPIHPTCFLTLRSVARTPARTPGHRSLLLLPCLPYPPRARGATSRSRLRKGPIASREELKSILERLFISFSVLSLSVRISLNHMGISFLSLYLKNYNIPIHIYERKYIHFFFF